MQLCQQVGWLYSKRDVERLYNLDPGGCFCAWQGPEYAGQVLSLVTGRIGTIGLVAVDERFRNRGIGRDLVKAAMGHLHDNRVATITLDASPQGLPIYVRLGFVKQCTVYHYTHTPAPQDQLPSQEHHVRHSGPRSGAVPPWLLDELAAFDARFFGAMRREALAALLPHVSLFLARSGEDGFGRLHGYCCARPIHGTSHTWVGPLIATSDSAAKFLLSQVLQTYGDTILHVGVPGLNTGASGLLGSYAFECRFELTRMYSGERPTENLKGVFGEAGHEKG